MTIIAEADHDLGDDLRTKYRGHVIVCIHDIWFFEDTLTPTAGNVPAACGHCGKNKTVEGYDVCLGTIPNIMNACCGHGEPEWAYIQYWDGSVVQGFPALGLMASRLNRSGVHGWLGRNEGLHT